jgi:Resolvase, N terminal domain
LTLLSDKSDPIVPICDSTDAVVCGIDSRYMTVDSRTEANAQRSTILPANRESTLASKDIKRAALYARVSTDAQQKEGTIKSQVAELEKQITEAGHVLVKEYIDDGYSGSRSNELSNFSDRTSI